MLFGRGLMAGPACSLPALILLTWDAREQDLGRSLMSDNSMTRRWWRGKVIGASLVIGLVGAVGAGLYPAVREARRAARASATL